MTVVEEKGVNGSREEKERWAQRPEERGIVRPEEGKMKGERSERKGHRSVATSPAIDVTYHSICYQG